MRALTIVGRPGVSMWGIRTVLATLVVACALAGCGSAGEFEEKGPVLLVAGATGGTGVEIVKQAQGQGYAVRALVRDEQRAREVLGDKVRYFVGDVTRPETLAP